MGVSAVILAGAWERAKETWPPLHISPCGCPAAQIKLFKTRTDTLGTEGAASDINQVSVLIALISRCQ